MKQKEYQKIYLDIAKEFSKKYSDDENIMGMTLNGGISRGTGDKYSEIDIHFYIKNKSKSNLPPKIKGIGNDVSINGVWFDIHIRDYKTYLKKKIGMSEKWDLANCKILFDRDNKLKRLIKEKTKLTKEEEENIEEDYGFGSDWCLQLAEVFVERGDAINANLLINKSLEYFINYYFYLNNKLIPHFKWKYYYFQKLKKPDNKIKRFIFNQMKIKEYSKKEALLRIKRIKKVLNKDLGRVDDFPHEQNINALRDFSKKIKNEMRFDNPFE